jgi:hypothetical protein
MPCWQRRTQTVDFERADVDLFVAGLQAEGWEARKVVSGVVARKTFGVEDVEVRWRDGRLEASARSTVTTERAIADATAAYTRAAFRQAAGRAGFQVREDRGRLIAARRRY